MNKITLQAEGFIVLILSLYYYYFNELSWIMFFIFLFAPDFSMIGYLYSNSFGAMLYNWFHTYSLSITAVLTGLILTSSIILTIGLIWTAHIAMDRMLGYGLKYPAAFHDTHFSRV